jgi:hypothetical protein
MSKGGQVWESIEGNNDFWDLISEGKSLVGNIKVGENESIFETQEVQALKQKGEANAPHLSHASSLP